ncbi:hypothetical protein PG996_000085 [Apiospora saccharicola]|uniref:Uncharacterized protein n=1 Tax=Apiospora saccharicola TaxID=335842 RepID=A0ABR1WGK6_9PEZI
MDTRVWDPRLPTGKRALNDSEVAAANGMTHRGCVYLDLATERFLPLCAEWLGGVGWDQDPTYGWLSAIGPNQEPVYGLRELSAAFTDFKYHGAPLDHDTLEGILERRPPVLRHTSLQLTDKVRTGIRHVVFPSYSSPPRPSPQHPWRQTERDHDNIAEAFDIAALNIPGRPFDDVISQTYANTYPWGSLVQAFPDALNGGGGGGGGAANGNQGPGPSLPSPSSTTSIWGFRANTETYRAFFDDLEEKGPEHLRIQRLVKRFPASGNDDDPTSWDLFWASEAWGAEDNKQGQRWLRQQRDKRNRYRMLSPFQSKLYRGPPALKKKQ